MLALPACLFAVPEAWSLKSEAFVSDGIAKVARSRTEKGRQKTRSVTVGRDYAE